MSDIDHRQEIIDSGNAMKDALAGSQAESLRYRVKHLSDWIRGDLKPEYIEQEILQLIDQVVEDAIAFENLRERSNEHVGLREWGNYIRAGQRQRYAEMRKSI